MNVDPHTQTPINRQGIWIETNCLIKEQAILDTVIARIEQHGYVQESANHRLWTKNGKKIVVCMVDDVRSASRDYETDAPYLFDCDTMVITDNYFSCAWQFRVLTLPHSFFGIYHHDKPATWQPDRQFCFSVNRLDDRRFRLMLELGKRSYLEHGYVNFNCQVEHSMIFRVPDPQELRANFESFGQHLSQRDLETYGPSYQMLRTIMPYRNYEIDHEQIHLQSRCNMIVESYGSDTTVAFSEKIFRALVLPVPWTIYGGHYAVAYLESLGFDCMSDIINHNHYDHLKEIEDKQRIYVWFSLKFARESQEMDQSYLRDRCQRAAKHNRLLLRNYQQSWSEDFSGWLRRLDQEIESTT